MKPSILFYGLSLIFFMSFTGLYAQAGGDGTWSKRYGGEKDDGAYSIIATQDGGFAMAGYTESFGEGNKDGWVLKLSATGDLLWQYTFGIPKSATNAEICKKIIQTSDGGFMVAGYVEDLKTKDKDAWLIRLNVEGKFLWEKRYGGTGEDTAADVIQTKEGDFVFAGYTKSFGTGDADFWILRVDIRGDIVWGRRYGSKADDEAVSLVQGKNGQFLVAGMTDAGGHGGKDAWIISIDGDGKIIWEKTYGREFNDIPQYIHLNIDGSCTLAGLAGGMVINSASGETKGSKLASFGWIMRLDSAGSLIWDKLYGTGQQKFTSLTETTAGDILVCGTTENEKSGSDYWICGMDKKGNELWNRSYGGIGTDTALGIAEVNPGDKSSQGSVVTGITDSYPGGKNIWTIRFDDKGLATE